jgi:hypothetical protein
MFWNAVLETLLFVLEKFGENIVKSTENKIDDVVLKALVSALRLIKF